MSKRLLLLLNNFEETLGGRLRKLNPKDKVANSAKGKILMRAMYGVKVETAFICSVFASAFSSFAKKLFDLNVDDKGFCGLKLLPVCKQPGLFHTTSVCSSEEIQSALYA